MRADEALISTALGALAARSAPLAALIERHGAYEPRSAETPDVFGALARSIIYQQLAGKAAASIHRRFAALFTEGVSARALLTLEVETIRGAGLSLAKTKAVIDLASHIDDGRLAPETLVGLDDEALTRALVQVRGIGPWTAQMFMLFQLGRLDIWPTGDLGVRRGFGHIFCGGETPTARALGPLGDPFRPYRSIVAWYCWRAADEAKGAK